ncbi:nucleotide pyrophosphohydrolase [Candidatus Falkowbacteria bacterium RIFOXYB2_FULL_35_7]|nr:MAG: nucleotide pyrophosphohydrolase [Candidatus Falkowbacteria bacterium RIFOXYB2_FULL_35_7]
MDHNTNIQELKQKVKDFCDERDWDQYHNAKELAIGIVTEASELLDHFRFKSESEIDAMLKEPIKREQISDEIADTFYFVLRLAQRYNIDLTTELDKKLQKNKEKYPIDKAKGSNRKYTEFEQ